MIGSDRYRRLLHFTFAVVVLYATLAIVLVYRDYFPPNFRSDFLLGRRSYFFGAYAWAFYAHIIAGPIALVSGLVLLSHRLRKRWPSWHRRLGRVHVLVVLALLVPSGLWMSLYAMTGTIAARGFAMLSLATGFCAAMGWRSAIGRRFAIHQRWMQRLFALLVSAIVLRLIGGASEVLALDNTYPAAAWVSWLLPLALLELFRHFRQILAAGGS